MVRAMNSGRRELGGLERRGDALLDVAEAVLTVHEGRDTRLRASWARAANRLAGATAAAAASAERERKRRRE
jgi:hypothetical protein